MEVKTQQFSEIAREELRKAYTFLKAGANFVRIRWETAL